MNKKMILGLATATLLATSALAYGGGSKSCDGYKNSCDKSKMMHKRSHKGGFKFVHMVMKLDLSDEQRKQIRKIVQTTMNSTPYPIDAFSDTSFDKEKFIKLHKQKREVKVQKKADMIEDIYELLDDSQKKDLKTMLDMKKMMKKSKMHNKKGGNC